MTEQQAPNAYQMLWDCTACETKKLLGVTHRHCPNCGSAQDPNNRYFPPEGEEIAVADHEYVGVDQHCPACESPNSAAANNCTNCGGPMSGAKGVHLRDDQVAADGAHFADDSAKAAKQERKARRSAASAGPARTKPASGGGKKILLIVGAVLLVVIIAVVVLVTWKKSVDLEAKGHRWTRTIAIEEFRAVSESKWRDQVPRAAYDMSCTKEVKSHKKVPAGKDCKTRRKDMGNGTFKKVRECKTKYKKEPVYGQKCRYRVDRWKVARTAKVEGAALSDKPTWPKVELARTGNCRGCQREGKRAETYEVDFLDGKSGKTSSCEFPSTKWSSIALGSKWKGKTGVVTGKLDCDALQPL